MKHKNIILVMCSIILFSTLNAEMSDTEWRNIGSYITTNGSDDNKGDFEAAKNALLKIKEKNNAAPLAIAIGKKWKTEATAKELIDLPRYPNMDAPQVKESGKKLFKNHKEFINDTLNMGCNIP